MEYLRYLWSKSSDMKNKGDVVPYNEEVFRREFEKAMNDGNMYGAASVKKGKRYRSAFTTEQVNYLEKEFKKYPYIGNARRKDVSNVLNIPERAVKIWFQNRRMKEKKESNKETEEKNLENNNNQPNNAYSPTSNNNNMNISLPLLNVNKPTSGLVNDNAESTISRNIDLSNPISQSTNNPNYYKDISSEKVEVNAHIANNIPTVIKNNPAPISGADFSMDLLKPYKTERSDTEDRKTDVVRNSPLTRQTSPLNQVIYKPEHMSYGSFATTPILPQDLSSKGNQQNKVPEAIPSPLDIKNPTEMPVYLKGFYAQPYLPPGNMIWKPVNVAPIVPSPIPTMAVPSSSAGQNIMKKSCNCDCHLKPEPMFRYFQNSPNPNLQYLITAVPYQNGPPKF